MCQRRNQFRIKPFKLPNEAEIHRSKQVKLLHGFITQHQIKSKSNNSDQKCEKKAKQIFIMIE